MSRIGNNYKNSINSFLGSLIILTGIIVASTLTGCGGSSAGSDITSVDVSNASTTGRPIAIQVLEPVAGNVTVGNDVTTIDYSNASEGYIIVDYTGDSKKIKFQLTGPDQVTYTYDIYPNEDIVMPLSADSGDYVVTLYEDIGNNQYSSNFSDVIPISIDNKFGPFLYPNQYVNFNKDTEAVKLALQLSENTTCELEVVAKVYEYVTKNVVYDKEEAETVESGYLPDVDEVIATGKGICFDYAALMAAMLRSQGIPTRLEIGYAKDAYHSWISIYTKDQGWIGGVIKFDGTNWTLMDPTLAANSKDSSAIKSFIGDGSSYMTKYLY